MCYARTCRKPTSATPARPSIKGDKRVDFVEVKNVLRQIQSVGFKNVGLVAQHVDEKGNVVAGNAAGAISLKK